MEWNAEGQLTRVTKNSIEQARFAYDPEGRRVEKVAGGVTTAYAYDGEDILREIRGAVTFRYVHGAGIDDPLAREDGSGALTYFHTDGLGSIVTRTSQGGAVVHQYRYDAWGEIEAGASEPGYAFTGREWEPEIGLHYYRARYYDARTARFASEDPLTAGRGRNLYVYAANRPLTYIDPWGLKEICTLAPKMEQCLEKVFKEDVSPVEVVREPKKNPKYGATTRRNKIILWDYTCSEFWNAYNVVLEEYYHVLRQWNTGRLSMLKYAWEYLKHGYDNKYEKEAQAFADEHTKELEECMKCRGGNP